MITRTKFAFGRFVDKAGFLPLIKAIGGARFKAARKRGAVSGHVLTLSRDRLRLALVALLARTGLAGRYARATYRIVYSGQLSDASRVISTELHQYKRR